MSSIAGTAKGPSTRGAYDQALKELKGKIGDDWSCPICLQNVKELTGDDRDAVALRTSVLGTACRSGAGGALSPHYIDKVCARILYNTGSFNCPICRAPKVLIPLFNPVFFGNGNVPNDLPIDEVRHLLSESKLNLTSLDALGRTPFHRAAEYGNVPYLTAMIEHAKEGVKEKDINRATPLQLAIAFKQLECVKLLIGADADVNTQSGALEETPLLTAVEHGMSEYVQVLLAAGSNVNYQDKREISPLFSAAFQGRVECLKLLVEAGANVNLENTSEQTALHWAVFNGHTECAKLLIAAGADVNKPTSYGEPPLLITLTYGYPECASLLIKAKADVNCISQNDETPILFAALWGWTECLKDLIKAGAEIDRGCSIGGAALHYAAQNGKTECVRILIDADAKLDLLNNVGRTALSLASESHQAECVEMLSSAMARSRQAESSPRSSKRRRTEQKEG